ncbi:MAG: HAD-IIB family hydrolase [Fimbriimonadaceae bacterium]|nr:HAD-IIB family hydrolase [Fimbriimonadaceae bacterium]
MIDPRQIAAVALDFDGTLIGPGHQIDARAVATLRRAAAAGIAVCTASGRPPGGQLEILTANGLGPASGVFAALCCDERSVWLRDGAGFVPHRPWNDAVDAEWDALLPVARELLREARQALTAAGYALRQHVPDELQRERGMVDFAADSEAAAVATAAWLRPWIAAREPRLQVTQNWHLVVLLPASVGKGRAVAAMAAALGLAPAQLLAVGDRQNDTTMLDGTCGLRAAAVGNAIPEIRALVAAQGGYQATAELGAGVAEIVEWVLAARAEGIPGAGP